MSVTTVVDRFVERIAHQGSRHRHHTPLVPGLDDRGVEALDGLRKPVKVGGDKTVGWEVLLEDIEELHEPGGDELRVREVGRKGHLGGEISQGGIGGIWPRIVAPGGSVADAEVAGSDGIELVDVELVEVAVAINEDVALERLLGGDVVPDAVVGEVVKDLHGEEEAG